MSSSPITEDVIEAQALTQSILSSLGNVDVKPAVLVLVALELFSVAAECARDREGFLTYLAARVLTLPRVAVERIYD